MYGLTAETEYLDLSKFLVAYALAYPGSGKQSILHRSPLLPPFCIDQSAKEASSFP